jgi:hypothetical protein
MTRYDKHPELRDHYIGILIKHIIQTEFLASLKHKINECAFAAQEAHTSLKSHHELNIWQRVSLLKVKLPQSRLIPQVTRQVSKEIKTLIKVVKKSN